MLGRVGLTLPAVGSHVHVPVFYDASVLLEMFKNIPASCKARCSRTVYVLEAYNRDTVGLLQNFMFSFSTELWVGKASRQERSDR